MINPVELMRILKELNTKMDSVIEENKALQAKIDTLIPKNNSTAKGNQLRDNLYDFYKKYSITPEKATELLSNLNNESIKFLFFYKTECGPCSGVLAKIKELISEEFIASPQMHWIPRHSQYANALVDKFKIKSYPTLIVLNKGVVISTHTGLPIVEFLTSVFKSKK